MENAKLLKGAVYPKYDPSQRRIRPSRDKERQVLLQNLIGPLVIQALGVVQPQASRVAKVPGKGFVLITLTSTHWAHEVFPFSYCLFQLSAV